MTQRWLDLVTDAGTGLLSHTKLWTQVAYLAATIAFLRLVLSDTPPGADIWLIYLGIVGGHNLASKIVSMKFKKDGAQ